MKTSNISIYWLEWKIKDFVNIFSRSHCHSSPYDLASLHPHIKVLFDEDQEENSETGQYMSMKTSVCVNTFST